MKIIILFFILFTIGCTKHPAPIAYNCPQLILPNDPIPRTRNLNSESRPDEVIKAWVATTVEYRGWNKAVRRQVESSK